MQIIKPRQISGEIMTLIEEADKKIILISPYFRVSKWYKLLNRFEAIKRRSIEVEIYVREGELESIEEVMQTGFLPIAIPNLHSKLYLNEKQAMVSSMNLLLSSDTNSLDIALKSENEKEYDDLFGYYARYIQNTICKPDEGSNGNFNWREELDKQLFKTLSREAYITEYKGKLQIQIGNKYEAFITNERSNNLRMFGILSGKEFDYARANRHIFQGNEMTIELFEGIKGHYDTIWGTVKDLKSQSINALQRSEELAIVDAIVKFIVRIEQLKQMAR